SAPAESDSLAFLPTSHTGGSQRSGAPEVRARPPGPHQAGVNRAGSAPSAASSNPVMLARRGRSRYPQWDHASTWPAGAAAWFVRRVHSLDRGADAGARGSGHTVHVGRPAEAWWRPTRSTSDRATI